MVTQQQAKVILDKTFPDCKGPYQDGVANRMSRYFAFLGKHADHFKGRIIDVGGQYGNFLALAEHLLSDLSEMTLTRFSPRLDHLTINGKTVRVINFHCERDRFPLDDKCFDIVIFTEVLEHLLYDPVWTMLEINRILRDGGILFLATPNAASLGAIRNILRGKNPAGSIEYKPTRLFERHNRIYTSREAANLMKSCGFQIIGFSTMPSRKVYYLAKCLSFLKVAQKDFPGHCGSTTLILAAKETHLTVAQELPRDVRWPAWLYSPRSELCKRPDSFIESEDDEIVDTRLCI